MKTRASRKTAQPGADSPRDASPVASSAPTRDTPVATGTGQPAAETLIAKAKGTAKKLEDALKLLPNQQDDTVRVVKDIVSSFSRSGTLEPHKLLQLDQASFSSLSADPRETIIATNAEELRLSLVRALQEVTDFPLSLRAQILTDAADAAAPSEAAKLKNLKKEQEQHPMAIGRPFVTTGPPITIYHKIFQRFEDLLQQPLTTGFSSGKAGNGSDTAGVGDTPINQTGNQLYHYQTDSDAEYAARANDLIIQSSEIYASEADRLLKVKPLLQKLLGRVLVPVPTPAKCIPDGVVLMNQPEDVEPSEVDPERLPPLLIMEAENEAGECGCDADTQAAFGFRKLLSGSEYGQALANSCCPCFLLSVVGPRVAVFGAICTEAFIVQPLTNAIHLAGNPSPSRLTQQLTRIFSALKTCLNELEQFYKNPRGQNPNFDDLLPITPHYKQINGYTLAYTSGNILQHRIGRAMFKALLTKSEKEEPIRVMVKFTTQYCSEAHKLLAGIKLAPRLHLCQQINNDWMIVVMDDIPMKTLDNYFVSEIPKTVLGDIRTALNLLHESGLVFGNLQHRNILVGQEDGGEAEKRWRAMLVDFDWAGEAGVKRYPFDLDLKQANWPKGVKKAMVMLQEHDMAMLQQLEASDVDGKSNSSQ